ncbi:hypothetical protein RND61_28635 [Streptomyces sp. TRM76323]|uniref:Uncharacterized protein n=1 Tax=Streptomyces tamarix TaxID=3078565 RepID=A0ABU3QTE3_9ACTN|nr:hypothetical protein [Streptomyces tamarix]MDT9686007.1 hypothetical protein [Streptomyces tamarix]
MSITLSYKSAGSPLVNGTPNLATHRSKKVVTAVSPAMAHLNCVPTAPSM